VERKEARYLTAGETQAVLAAAADSPHHLILTLIAATGLRRGEALALTWENLDLSAGLVHVRRTVGHVDGKLIFSTPKTKRSRRSVPITAPVIALLRARKKEQAAERLRAGSQWEDNGLVFTTELGATVDPRGVLRSIKLAAEASGVPGVRLHTLRHSAAVGWLEAGVHIRAVADLLGHSSIAVTGDIYGHTSEETARNAIEAWMTALES
jgi:integrase